MAAELLPVRDSVRLLKRYEAPSLQADCRLDLNESAFDWDESFRRELQRRLQSRSLRRYPDAGATRLRQALASRYGLAPQNIVAGNGSNELLMTAFQTFVSPGQKVVLLRPSFGLYESLATLAGALIVRVDVDPEVPYLPIDDLCRECEGAVVVVGSPNNPTGGILQPADLRRLLAGGAFVFLDRAYGEYAGDLLPQLHDRLVTFSTFSKAWALAACRIGWIATTEANSRELEKVKLPYNLDLFSEEAALLALERAEWMERRVLQTTVERERVSRALAAIPAIQPFPSFGNFIAFRVDGGAKRCFDELARRGVLLRNLSNVAGMEETLRVTIGSPSENDRFLRALRETLGLDPSSPNTEVQVPASSRSASVTRATGETQIAARVDLDGKDAPSIETPIGFLSHMLHVIARHGQLDLDIRVAGDVEIDYHHTVEDTALVLGEAVRRALGDRRGVRRFGSAYVPLDESLARVVIDFSGRPFLSFEAPVDREMLLIHKDFPFALIEEFFKSFANACACNIHVDLLRGRNGHHAAEAIFKAFALALRSAKEVIADDIPSTKGVLA
jgi:histidinol-phosphate aminotransferase